MRRLSAIVIVLALAAFAPSSFTLAQTATPAPTPTPDYRSPVLVGSVQMFAGPIAPGAGWLEADGSCISRTTYDQLFAVYGTYWGVCDGSTTFALPDLRGQVMVAAGDHPTLSNRTLGDTGGEETHTMTVTEMPVHAHAISDFGHSHTIPRSSGVGGSNLGANMGVSAGTTPGSTGTSFTGINISPAGGGAPFNIMQPFTVLSFHIWSGVVPMVAVSPADIDLTVVVVFPSHTPTPTLTPSLTPTDGPSPTPTATASPTGQPGYQLSYTVGGQEVLMDYTVRPGDGLVGGTLLFIAGLMVMVLFLAAKRGQS